MNEIINNNSLLSRGITVITVIGNNPNGAKFSQVAMAIGNPSPRTTSKILKELINKDVIKKNDDGSYSLSSLVINWALSIPRITDIREMAFPLMKKLSDKFRVSVNLLQYRQNELMCLESIQAPYSPSLLGKGISRPCIFSLVGSLFFMGKEERGDVGKHLKDIHEIDPSAYEKPATREEIIKILDIFEKENVYDDCGHVYTGIRRFGVSVDFEGVPLFSVGVGFITSRGENNDFVLELKKAIFEVKGMLEDEIKFFNIEDNASIHRNTAEGKGK
jgi:DNA-binding IclR family transcriptional regulator